MNNKFLKTINKASKVLHTIGAIILGFIFLLIVLEVILRPLGKSFTAVGEVTEYAIVWCVYLALPYITAEEVNIKVDLITRLLSKKTQKILSLINNIICIIFSVLLFYKGIELVYTAYITSASTLLLRIPLYFMKIVFPLSMVFFILELIAGMIKIVVEGIHIETPYEEAKKEAFVE